jgi:hypothetical protein
MVRHDTVSRELAHSALTLSPPQQQKDANAGEQYAAQAEHRAGVSSGVGEHRHESSDSSEQDARMGELFGMATKMVDQRRHEQGYTESKEHDQGAPHKIPALFN